MQWSSLAKTKYVLELPASVGKSTACNFTICYSSSLLSILVSLILINGPSLYLFLYLNREWLFTEHTTTIIIEGVPNDKAIYLQMLSLTGLVLLIMTNIMLIVTFCVDPGIIPAM